MCVKRAFVTGGSGFLGRKLIATLVGRGVAVVALSRSEKSDELVKKHGATPVRGDLDDTSAMQAGMAGCQVVFHAAAYVDEHGKLADHMRVTVEGTKHALAAARAAGVPRFVHVGTEAVLADGKPIVRADETRPYAAKPAGPYSRTKALAEQAVLAANGPGLTTVSIRPRFIWGADDTSLMPKLIEAVNSGTFAWIGGGHYLTSTCHVDTVVEGALLAAEKGTGGETYFLTDGEPVDFREFMTALLATHGVDAGTKSVPRWLAKTAATLTAWMKRPPVTKQAVALIGGEVTVVDAKARRELGYQGKVTRDAGLAEMRAVHGAGA
ncbi:MAG: NAD-dependent epimerase/dehydratase family protein [Myxococcales bacterium]|nr:NAD-dependent epimerase/dehydratase family protein [Myxococcales bacterium]